MFLSVFYRILCRFNFTLKSYKNFVQLNKIIYFYKYYLNSSYIKLFSDKWNEKKLNSKPNSVKCS